VESGGNDYAIGDYHLKNKAYGCMQIRQPACDDINRVFNLKRKAEDHLGNRNLSVDSFRKYMAIYATAKRLGREPFEMDKARIWNGGPNGWQNNSTLLYWNKVKGRLNT